MCPDGGFFGTADTVPAAPAASGHTAGEVAGTPPAPSSQIPALSPYAWLCQSDVDPPEYGHYAGPQDLGWWSGTPNWCQRAGDGSRYR